MDASAPNSTTSNAARLPLGQKTQDNITGWLYILPAMALTFLFGIFPIGYAVYMSFYGRRVGESTFKCTDSGAFVLSDCFINYTEIVGNWWYTLVFVLGITLLVGAYWLWAGDKDVFKKPLPSLDVRGKIGRIILPLLLVIASGFFFYIGQNSLNEVSIIREELSALQEPLEEPRLRRASDNALLAWEQSIQTNTIENALRRCDADGASVEAILACANETHAQAEAEISNRANRTQVAGYLQLLFIPMSLGVAVYILAFAHRLDIAKGARYQDLQSILGRAVPALILVGLGSMLTAAGYGTMLSSSGEEEFIRGLTITLYFAFGSVPFQLALGLVLAYILFQKLGGRELFRTVFFVPYVTPAVASAVIFNGIFSPQQGLANNIVNFFGGENLDWLFEADSVINIIFGTSWTGFWAGPSLALVSIIVVGIWTYTGYNAVIFLAGLGQIPGDLYEAARVDGANEWHLFRYITLPMISPITYYLSVLAFIGTFKAFNTIFVMRTPGAQGTVDTASLIVYETFKARSQYGLATAQAILLFLVIMGLTQVQRTFFEKKVFYG